MMPTMRLSLSMTGSRRSLNWFRPIAEHNLKQSFGSLQQLLNVTRRMVGELDKQALAFREHSMSLAEETIANTLECGFKLLRLREPQELAQIQTDLSRQAQAIADQTKEFNERFVKGAEQLANAAAESARRQHDGSDTRCRGRQKKTGALCHACPITQIVIFRRIQAITRSIPAWTRIYFTLFTSLVVG
jgi:hypothetical protein